MEKITMTKTNNSSRDILGRKYKDSDSTVPKAPAKVEATPEPKAMTAEEELTKVKAQLAVAEAELAGKKAMKGKAIRVSKKGCVSVYGFGRFPVSYYKSQWVGILNMKDQILKFIEENEADLPEKSATAKK